MKKIVITLVLGFAVSIQSFASNNIINNSKTQIDSNDCKKLDCYDVEIESYFGECPDGSEYYAGSLIVVTECDSPGNVLGFGFDYGSSYEDACGD
jgi:hypothetical protein